MKEDERVCLRVCDGSGWHAMCLVAFACMGKGNERVEFEGSLCLCNRARWRARLSYDAKRCSIPIPIGVLRWKTKCRWSRTIDRKLCWDRAVGFFFLIGENTLSCNMEGTTALYRPSSAAHSMGSHECDRGCFPCMLACRKDTIRSSHPALLPSICMSMNSMHPTRLVPSHPPAPKNPSSMEDERKNPKLGSGRPQVVEVTTNEKTQRHTQRYVVQDT